MHIQASYDMFKFDLMCIQAIYGMFKFDSMCIQAIYSTLLPPHYGSNLTQCAFKIFDYGTNLTQSIMVYTTMGFDGPQVKKKQERFDYYRTT